MMQRFAAVAAVIGLGVAVAASSAADALPVEPLEIGTRPQFVFDNYVVDNHWAIRYKNQSVERVFHQPVKYEGNPVITGEGGYACVVRDGQTGLFRMWYQTWTPSDVEGKSGQYAIAYAESKDGVHWTLPKLALHTWKGNKENNIVWRGPRQRRASSVVLLDVPEEARRGYRYLFQYSASDGIHLIGSHDGIHWDAQSDMRICHIHSDTQNVVVYDAQDDRYVMYCRAKHIYRTFRGEMIDTGASRRVALMTSKELWTEWDPQPQNILIPDELDTREKFNFFYGMPVKVYGGVFWGFLWPFKMNSDIHTELAFSRDGVHFDRLADRPKLIARGSEGTWDDGMAFGCRRWVEVGERWWFYYAGWDGPHGIRQRTPGIGLATLRKEGFISMRGPVGGGVVSTRRIRWNSASLLVNVDARGGELKVRVTDQQRKPLPGFDYDDCNAFSGDSTSHRVTWIGGSLQSLTDQVIRLEFYLKDADLYTFRATGVEATR